jgi:phosphoglycolate phosphatase
MVGDAEPDVGTARDAGVPVIGVTFGYTPTPMEKLEPDVIVDAFEDVEEAVDMLVVDHYVLKAMAV